jgi:hypothetical protein
VTRYGGPANPIDAVRDLPGTALTPVRDYLQNAASYLVSQGVKG